MTTYFMSDLHLGHGSAIKFTGRSFRSVDVNNYRPISENELADKFRSIKLEGEPHGDIHNR